MTGLRLIQPIFILAVLIPWIALSQIFTSTHLSDTADGVFHAHRIYAMSQLMLEGSIYPRWIPWFHLGYGYPVFNYYAPLPTWLGGALGLVGITAPVAFQLITAASWMGGAVGMAALARRFLPDTAAIIACALWVYAPARMHEYWIQGSLSHVVATALIPWFFLTLFLMITRPSRRRALQFGVCGGLLLLSHQPTAYLMALCGAGSGLAMFVWANARRKISPKQLILYGGVSLVIALGISAVLTLPLLFELEFIVIEHAPTGNIPAELHAHFIEFSDLFRPVTALDHSDLSATIPHTYGLLPAILALAGLLALLMRRSWLLAALLGIGAAVSVFLVTPGSLEIWEGVPLMAQLRFPWRILRIGIVPVALLGACPLLIVPTRWVYLASGALLVVVISSALPSIYPVEHTVDFADQTSADFIRYELSSGAIGGTSYNEFEPTWGAYTPTDAPIDLTIYETDPMHISALPLPGVTLEQISSACWLVTTDNAAYTNFRQFYFPGWQATLNGDLLPVDAEPVYGLLQVLLPRTSQGHLCLAYVGTPLQNTTVWLSAGTWITVIVLWLTSVSDKSSSGPSTPTLGRNWMILVGGLSVFGAVLNGFWIGPHTQLFRVASPLGAPQGMAVNNLHTFERGYDLLGYTLHNTTATPGEALSITLYWRPQPATDSRQFYPVIQFGNLAGTNTWGSSELPFIGYTPHHHSPNQFISHRVEIVLFDDTPAFVGQISVRLVDRSTNASVPLSTGERAILPDVVHIAGSFSTQAPDEEAYLIADVITLTNVALTHDADNFVLDLQWKIQKPLPDDTLMFFLHGLNENGEVTP